MLSGLIEDLPHVSIERVEVDYLLFIDFEVSGWGPMLESRAQSIHVDPVRREWDYDWSVLQKQDLNHPVDRDDARSAFADLTDEEIRQLFADAMRETLDEQRRCIRVAAAAGIERPLSIEPEPTIAHVMIDEDLGRAIVAADGDAFLTDMIRWTMKEGYLEEVEVLEGDDVSVRIAVPVGSHGTAPYISFHGDMISVTDIVLPETIANGIVGRKVGEVVDTGIPGLDERTIEAATQIDDRGIGVLWISVSPRCVDLKTVGCRAELVDGSHPADLHGRLPETAYARRRRTAKR